MRSTEYEIVTGKIAQSVFARKECYPAVDVLVGQDSKWKGQSGFVHQIDVAIQGPADIIMVECKHWRTKTIKAEHLLTFIARINDIRPTLEKVIHPVFVTCNQFQRGCHYLAKFYDIDLQIIASADSFAFQYKEMRIFGTPAGRVNLTGHPPSPVISKPIKHVD